MVGESLEKSHGKVPPPKDIVIQVAGTNGFKNG